MIENVPIFFNTVHSKARIQNVEVFQFSVSNHVEMFIARFVVIYAKICIFQEFVKTWDFRN